MKDSQQQQPLEENLWSVVLGPTCTLDITKLNASLSQDFGNKADTALNFYAYQDPLWRCYPYNNALMPCWLRINNNESTMYLKIGVVDSLYNNKVHSLLFYLLKVR